MIRAVHLTQMRTAVNAVRTLATLPAAVLTDPVVTPGVTIVELAHIDQLRAALHEALLTLTLPSPFLQRTTIVPQPVPIVRAEDVNELRNAVK